MNINALQSVFCSQTLDKIIFQGGASLAAAGKTQQQRTGAGSQAAWCSLYVLHALRLLGAKSRNESSS